jgi:hypothetical protein
MNWKLINSHLANASNYEDSFRKFDALWAAFNVMYESQRDNCIRVTGHRGPSERDCIRYCTSLLPYAEWIILFPSRLVNNLFSIAPIFNVRDYLRRGDMNTNEFDNLLRLNLINNIGNPTSDLPKLYALMDLLYIVRCNKIHGFKVDNIPRDREVLDVTTPILEAIVLKLNDYFFSLT